MTEENPTLLYYAACALLVVLFGGAMGWLAWQDHLATQRCHALGGQTYDSGQHCVVGGQTRSTR